MKSALAAMLLVSTVTPLAGQWLTHRDPAIPRTRDGKPNLLAPAPRASSGKPDLSGVWQVEPTAAEEMTRLFGDVNALSVPGDDVLTFSKYFLNILADFKPDASPLRPEAAALFRQRSGNRGTESPTANCLPPGIPSANLSPSPHKIVQTPKLIVVIYEMFSLHRQVYLDDRKLPANPDPLWLGYSVGKWDGDTLQVDTAGFNDKSWLDAFGHTHSEDLHIVERFRRRSFGYMDVELTVEDPKTYSRPFTIRFTDRLVPDSDIGEFFCAENELDRAHIAAGQKPSAR